ncbi:MAG TPA: 2OG-Fe dioxygenase family protein [Rhabdochlamydiaceae bacterium]|nr:2OG-Fe dioxygenase family protein [Rhabdochlamydiaceae bacterium]
MTQSLTLSQKIAEQLTKHNYVIVKDVLKVDKSLESSFSDFGKAFDKLTAFRNSRSDDFLSRKVDVGDFDVKSETVCPALDKSHPQFENKDLYKNIFLKALIQFTVSSLPGGMGTRHVEALLSRHDHSVDALFAHTDHIDTGVSAIEWVVQYNISRTPEKVCGGEIQILERREVVAKALLEKPLDCYFINDHKFMHATKELTIEKGGVRDTLILRIFKG